MAELCPSQRIFPIERFRTKHSSAPLQNRRRSTSMNIGSEMKCLTEPSTVPFQTAQFHIAIQSLDSRNVFPDQESSAGWTLEQPAFNELLNWFAPDPETAGQQYELIRQKLITLFRYR